MDELMSLSVRAGLGGLLILAGGGLACLHKGNRLHLLDILGILLAVGGLAVSVVYGWKLTMAMLAIPEVRSASWKSCIGGVLLALGLFLIFGEVKFFQKRKAFQVLGYLLVLTGAACSIYQGIRLLVWYCLSR